MRGNLILLLLGEALARDMIARGVSGGIAETWLLDWERECSSIVVAGKPASTITSHLFSLLSSCRQLIDQANGDNGR